VAQRPAIVVDVFWVPWGRRVLLAAGELLQEVELADQVLIPDAVRDAAERMRAAMDDRESDSESERQVR
jgi:hypothetical protein